MSQPMSDGRLISQSLTKRGLSTVVTALTVGVGVALMLSLLGLSESARTLFTRGTGNMHLLVTQEPSTTDSVLNSIYYANAPSQALNWDQFQAQTMQRRMPLEWAIPTQLGDSYQGLPVMATNAEFFERFEPVVGEPWAFAQGGAFTDAFDVVLGSAAAQRLGYQVGDTLQITHGYNPSGEAGHKHDRYTWTVRGILAPSGSLHDAAIFQTVEATWVIHAHDRRMIADGPDAPLTTVEDLQPHDRLVTAVYTRVATRPGRNASAMQEPIRLQLQSMGYTATSPSETIRQVLATVGNVEIVLIAMAGVVLVSSGLGILLALYNSMEQRRRQIAVLRVLGASKGRILRLVLLESAVIGFIGTAIGWALTIFGSAAVAGFLRDRLGFGIAPVLPLHLIGMVSAGSMLLAVLSGLVPAIRAYRVPVVRSLRPLG